MALVVKKTPANVGDIRDAGSLPGTGRSPGGVWENILFSLYISSIILFSSVQSLSPVQLFVTPWTAGHQASPSIANSRNLLKFMSIESVMPSNHLIPSSPSPPAFNLSQHQGLFQWICSLHQMARALELELQHQPFQWFPLGLTGLMSLLSKGLSRVFSNTTVQKHQFFSAQLYGPTLTSIHDYWKNHRF